MQAAPFPLNEELRMNDLIFCDILDSPEEDDFNDLAALAAQTCNCHSAAIVFIDKERQWFKARKNIPYSEGPRDTSFCAHAILGDEVMMVNDTGDDERFFDNPDVTGGLHIGFYAGTPIVSTAGYKLGTVCAMDRNPKNGLDKQQETALRTIANQVSRLLELRVKNRQIVENTEALVAAERKIAQLNLQAEEEEKTHIAKELHENFAQTLAAVNMYLGFAESSKDLADHFIQKSKENISFMIEEVKALSKAITPTTFENADYIGIIEDHARDFCKSNSIHLYFTSDDDIAGCDHDTGLALFRIVQSQLKIAKSGNATWVTLAIEKHKAIRLSITDNGRAMQNPDAEVKLLLKNIVTRTELLNGKIKTGIDEKGNNIIQVDMPVYILHR